MCCSWWLQYRLLWRRAVWTTLRNASESATRVISGCYLGMAVGTPGWCLQGGALSTHTNTHTTPLSLNGGSAAASADASNTSGALQTLLF